MESKTDVSKFLNNKQFIHIATEVVVLIGISFYFSSKNKKLSGHIEELSQRIEEQEDIIQKLQTQIQQLSVSVSQLSQQWQVNFKDVVNMIPRQKEVVKKTKKTTCPPPKLQEYIIEKQPRVNTEQKKVSFSSENSISQQNKDEESIDDVEDSDLEDEEIQEELQELDNLKKSK
jgi:uncharacterized coiled-coil protein SlyX